MDAVFDLFTRSPNDERLILAAVGLAESEKEWSKLLALLCLETVKPDFMSKTYLETLTSALKHTDLDEWPLSHIERILVYCLPKWGSLIPRDSLPSLFGLILVTITNGLAVASARSEQQTKIPGSIEQNLGSKKESLLRILWYSSALPIISTVLKVRAGESEDSMENLLLAHNHDDTHRQTVVASQEVALACLAETLVVSRDPQMSQLATALKQASLESVDSSSLPLPVAIAGFVAGIVGVKIRAETQERAAQCFAGLLEVAELSPSLFTSRNRNLIQQVIQSAIEGVKDRKSESCARLLDVIASRLPALGFESEKLMEAIQTYQELFRSSAVLETTSSIKDADISNYTSGRAVALVRLNDKAKSLKFLESSLGDPDWVRANMTMDRESVKLVGNFFSMLQSLRIRQEWVLTPYIHEPTLTYLARHVTDFTEKDLSGWNSDVNSINAALKHTESILSLVRSFKLLLSGYDKSMPSESNVMERIQLSILSVFVKIDVDTVREFPEIIAGLMELLEIALQSIVSTTGLVVNKSDATNKSDSRKILFTLVQNALPFAKHAAHVSLLEASFRVIPYITMGEDIANELDSIDSLIDQILHSVPLQIALTTAPSALSTLEALAQARASTMDTRLRSQLTQYLLSLVAEACRLPSIQKPVIIQLLSVLSSTLIVSESISSSRCEVIWTMLACHPVIQEAAAAPSWDGLKLKYSTNHLVWIHSLNMAVVLLSLQAEAGSAKFFSAFSDLMAERFNTAHTSDLATLEEACLISRLYELSPGQRSLPLPFQMTALITPKPPTVYPKSRAEKLAGNLPDLFNDDVRSPCLVPSVFSQRVVWIAADTLASSLRRISKTRATDGTQFHALIDCSHFVIQYLAELGGHKARVIKTVDLGGNVSYVPLSVQLSVDGRDLKSLPPVRKSVGGGGSLLSSMSSPPLAASKQPAGPASLMDSLTPRNSPKNKENSETDKEIKFLPPLPGDCPFRTGLSFVAPALITDDDFNAKLVDVLTLCLVQATRLANTESLVRPLLDLLLTTKSSGAKLPADALDVIEQVISLITPRHNHLAELSRHSHKKTQNNIPISPQIGPSLPYSTRSSGLGYAALSNIR